MTPEELCNHVRWSLDEAHEGRSKLDDETLAIGGFSTPFQRRLMNNLCSRAEGYLEVGLFRGGTFCAAGCGNKELALVGVEDFSQPFGEEGVREDLARNIKALIPKTKTVVFYDSDCWSWNKICNFADVGMYDGEHSLASQSRALPHFLECMKGSFIWVVDDFSWGDVKNGTKNGFELLKNKIRVRAEWVFHVDHNDDPKFHNGLGIFVIEKI